MDLFTVTVSTLGNTQEAMVLAKSKASAVSAFLEEIMPENEDLHEILISQTEGSDLRFKLRKSDEVMKMEIEVFISILSFFEDGPIIFEREEGSGSEKDFWFPQKGVRK